MAITFCLSTHWSRRASTTRYSRADAGSCTGERRNGLHYATRCSERNIWIEPRILKRRGPIWQQHRAKPHDCTTTMHLLWPNAASLWRLRQESGSSSLFFAVNCSVRSVEPTTPWTHFVNCWTSRPTRLASLGLSSALHL